MEHMQKMNLRNVSAFSNFSIRYGASPPLMGGSLAASSHTTPVLISGDVHDDRVVTEELLIFDSKGFTQSIYVHTFSVPNPDNDDSGTSIYSSSRWRWNGLHPEDTNTPSTAHHQHEQGSRVMESALQDAIQLLM